MFEILALWLLAGGVIGACVGSGDPEIGVSLGFIGGIIIALCWIIIPLVLWQASDRLRRWWFWRNHHKYWAPSVSIYTMFKRPNALIRSQKAPAPPPPPRRPRKTSKDRFCPKCGLLLHKRRFSTDGSHIMRLWCDSCKSAPHRSIRF